MYHDCWPVTSAISVNSLCTFVQYGLCQVTVGEGNKQLRVVTRTIIKGKSSNGDTCFGDDRVTEEFLSFIWIFFHLMLPFQGNIGVLPFPTLSKINKKCWLYVQFKMITYLKKICNKNGFPLALAFKNSHKLQAFLANSQIWVI